MDNKQAHMTSNMHQAIEESLKEYVADVFDDRNDYMTEEAYDFILCLESLKNCENEKTKELLECTITESKERLQDLAESELIPINQIVNIKSNAGISRMDDNRPLPDVAVFSTLYNKGYIKDSYMQKRVAGQLQSVKLAAANLMKNGLADRTLRSNPRVLVTDWIDYQSITDWNDKLIRSTSSELSSLPSVKELLSAMLPSSDCLEQSIVEGTFEDMSVNTLMSYTFATVVALIVKQESLKEENYSIIKELFSLRSKVGLNGFFVANAMASNLAFAMRLYEDHKGTVLSDDDWGAFHDILGTLQRNANTFRQWANEEKNMTILLPSKNVYPKELASLLQKVQTAFGFSISEEVASWGIPIPMSMKGLSADVAEEGVFGNMLEESVKIGRGLMEIEDIAWTTESNTAGAVQNCLDSLAEGFQVESERNGAANPFASLSTTKIHAIIMECQNRLFTNALRYDRDALQANLAENLLMLEWLNPVLGDTNLSAGEKKLLKRDAIQMDFQNKKYIGLVETDSMESLLTYADDNRERLCLEIFATVKTT